MQRDCVDAVSHHRLSFHFLTLTNGLFTSAIHHEGPYISILEQPQSKFRFRYKSEMVGTHGQLKADRAEKNRAAFPTVKVRGDN